MWAINLARQEKFEGHKAKCDNTTKEFIPYEDIFSDDEKIILGGGL